MINIQSINKTGLFFIFTSCLIQGCSTGSSIPTFVKQEAVSAVGFDFDTKKIIVANSQL